MILFTVVVVTMYVAPIGAPLYCDRGNGLVYDENSEWVAWDFKELGGKCGDWIDIYSNGVRRQYRAWDSGPFSHHCVIIGDTCPRIMVDIPKHVAWFPGLSLQVDSVRNWSEMVRECERMGIVQ